MFRVKWDSTNNGILLSEYIEEKDAINSPRPVYVDELKMLGIDKQIVLPRDVLSQLENLCMKVEVKRWVRQQKHLELIDIQLLD